ncbi:MAG: cytidine deaminase [Hyphomicrobiales bacterium]|nr:cytidine deaminase [Hyphomicrobiales bacterium]
MTPETNALFDAAKAAQARAYVPYSRFRVGAAVRAANGIVYAGCNVENAAYPVGNCAEASAIAAMVMAGETRILEALVIGDGAGLCTPCGGCRQRLREFGAPRIKVHIADSDRVKRTFTLDELLPFSFGPDNLIG